MPIEEIPRAPLVHNLKSGTVDETDGYAKKIDAWRSSAREEARRMHRMNMEVANVSKYIRYLQGDFWDPKRPRWRSKFSTNRLQKSRYDDLAQLTDARPVIDISSPVKAFEKIAKVVHGILRYEWVRQDLDLSLIYAADICKAYGTSFWKLGAEKPGRLRVTPLGPDQVMPIQPSFDIQDSSAVLYRTWKTIQFIKRKFPFASADIEREATISPTYGLSDQESMWARPHQIDEHVWNGLNPGLQRTLSRGKKGGPPTDNSTQSFFSSIELEEYYVDDPSTNDSTETVRVSTPWLTEAQHNWWYDVDPHKPLFPRKRHIIFAGKRVLSDGPSPYWHGKYPFAVLRLNPVFYSFWGLSKYRDLIPLNQAINEIMAGMMDMIKRALNPTSITKDNVMPMAAWNQFFPDMPGAKLKVNPNVGSLNDAMRYMEAPNIPAYVFQTLQTWLGPEFDRASGSMDIAGLGKKKQAPGGDTWEQMRDSVQTGLRLEGRQIEVFLRDAGVMTVSNILQFYDAPERLAKLGEDGITWEDFNSDTGTLLPELPQNARPDFYKNLSLIVSPGSIHGGAKDRSKQLAFLLAKSHMLPIRKLYEDLEFADPQGLLDELQAQNKAMQGAGPTGRVPAVNNAQKKGKGF